MLTAKCKSREFTRPTGAAKTALAPFGQHGKAGRSSMFKLQQFIIAFLVIAACGAASSVKASPGRLDANGCHQSKTQGYHCHDSRYAGTSGESQRERDRRMTRECRGKSNAGACLGYGQ